ncbi:MAG TPA: Rieske (2Fe-2S) protein [Kofleriaceae bacterium]|nr:Rieske (2Fe-2S) protein [Kofleriaceae bacterium]
MKSAKLPICGVACSRRALLQGLGAAALASLAPSCTQAGSDLPTGKTSSCSSSDVCLDLSDPANSALASPGGALLVDTTRDTIMVIRMSQVDVVALSAICTHAGCSMNFNTKTQQIDCPCHGSVFGEDGSVIHGPASRPLAVYTASLDTSTNTITITL